MELGKQGKQNRMEAHLPKRIIEKLYIENLLAVLSDEERDLLVLRFVNDEPISLICDELNISRFALYRRIQKYQKEIKGSNKNIEIIQMNENNRVVKMIKIKENNEGRNDEWIRKQKNY